MVSARTGGFAVALGIGYAVAAGTGVASADSADGTAGGDTPSSTSAASASPTSVSSTTKPATHAAKTPKIKTPTNQGDDTTTDSTPDDTRSEGVRTHDVPKSGAASDSGHPKAQKSRGPKPAVSDNDATNAPTDAPEPKPVGHTDVTPLLRTEAVAKKPTRTPEDPPAAPLDDVATATLAAASRREIVSGPTSLVQEQGDTKLAAATMVAAATPKVIATEQIAPLAVLQQIPVLGPLLVTPIVALIHQIPVVGDVLHPLIGYPVQWGLPANAPRPRDVKVTSDDGTEIYVHFMPAIGTAGKPAPTVLNGPGLGLPGATNIDGTFLDPILTDTTGLMSIRTLRQAGYNVVTWDPRGEWNSEGIVELNSPEFEGHDMSAIISWIATQPDALLDSPGDPRLGMVGVSYGGGIQLVTAAGDHRVDAIVPAITYNALTSALYKNDAFKSSWATPLTAALELLGGRINPRILPAAIYGDLTGQLSDADLALFSQRNPEVSDITAPTLLIQGTVDALFTQAEADATAQALLGRVPVKVIWFCGGHGVCANNLFDLSDGALIEKRTLQWLDRYVKLDKSVDTGPQFEWVDQRGQWYSSPTYPVAKGTPLVVSVDGEQTLPLFPYIGGSGLPFVPYALPAGNAINLKVPANPTATTYLVGAPNLTLTYSGTGTARHVYAQLVDNQTGAVLGTTVTPISVDLDGISHTIKVDLEPVSWTLRPGESVTLQLMSDAGLYQTIVPTSGTLTVTGMSLSMPTAIPGAAASAGSTAVTAVA